MLWNIAPSWLVLHYTYADRRVIFPWLCRALMLLVFAVGIAGVLFIWLLFPRPYSYASVLSMTQVLLQSAMQPTHHATTHSPSGFTKVKPAVCFPPPRPPASRRGEGTPTCKTPPRPFSTPRAACTTSPWSSCSASAQTPSPTWATALRSTPAPLQSYQWETPPAACCKRCEAVCSYSCTHAACAAHAGTH